MRWIILGLPLALAACMEPDQTTGAEDFGDFCAGCHGMSGKGDGDAAALLDRKPADLTTISARNGGVFPGTAVMAKIWGYTGGKDGEAVMPNFGPLLDSPLVPYDAGDGIESPTPLRLVQLAEYVGRLQR